MINGLSDNTPSYAAFARSNARQTTAPDPGERQAAAAQPRPDETHTQTLTDNNVKTALAQALLGEEGASAQEDRPASTKVDLDESYASRLRYTIVRGGGLLRACESDASTPENPVMYVEFQGSAYLVEVNRVDLSNASRLEVLAACQYLSPGMLPEPVFDENGKAVLQKAPEVPTDGVAFWSRLSMFDLASDFYGKYRPDDHGAESFDERIDYFKTVADGLKQGLYTAYLEGLASDENLGTVAKLDRIYELLRGVSKQNAR